MTALRKNLPVVDLSLYSDGTEGGDAGRLSGGANLNITNPILLLQNVFYKK